MFCSSIMVGYSKLLIEEQKERLRQLTEIVLATSQVAKSTNEQLVRLPTGDGMALVFRNSSEEPAQCALEIAQALKEHPEVAVRMGIHSGPVSEVTDVSGRSQRCRRRDQHGTAGDGLRRCGAHPALAGGLRRTWSNTASGSRACTIWANAK